MILTIVEKNLLKNICAKIKVEKEIERRGDSIGKITFGITREETKKIINILLKKCQKKSN